MDCLTLVSLFCFFIPSTSVSTVPPPSSLPALSQHFTETFDHHSHFSVVKEDISRLSRELRLKPEKPQEILSHAAQGIERLLTKRTTALRRLTRAAEKSLDEYKGHGDLNDEQLCDTFVLDILLSDVHNITNDAVRSTQSATHINIESYKCDSTVIRDFEWTGSPIVEQAMQENAKESSPPSQFIGTYSGLTRMHPRRHWRIEPVEISIDLFDPKFRPWFVNAEAAPRDIVFLVDYSGSMKGPTMHLTRITLLYILSTLSPNDFVSALWFSSSYAPMLQCNNRSFIPATTRNKKVLYQRVMELEEKDQAILGPPLKYSIQLLRDTSEKQLFGDSRSGAHKLIILMTDGIDEWPYGVIHEQLVHSNGDKVRVYGLAMGFATGPLPLLHLLACLSNASTSLVDSIADVKMQSRAYLNHLSSLHALVINKIPIEERPVSWSRLYMDAQGEGPVMTLSMPVTVRKDHLHWTSISRLAAVAGVDVRIKELGKLLPHDDKLQLFVVDNNGIILYHPRHVIPKSEVHAVRRSACYDASHVRHKSAAGLRVQYGHSDERVYRLVGLIDSIPTIDLYEVEGNSTVVQSLRKMIVERKCDGSFVRDQKEGKEYSCLPVKDSPYTVILYRNEHHASFEYTGDIEDLTLSPPKNPMVHYLYTKRDGCNWELDKAATADKYEKWITSPQCREDQGDSEIVGRALAKAIDKWTASWPYPLRNQTCQDAAFPGLQFDPSFYLNSFVHTRGQVTAYYPSCTWPLMKDVVRKFDMERLRKDKSDALHLSVRNDILILYRPILDDHGNRLAVVGTQWRLQYLSKFIAKFTEEDPEWKRACDAKDCLLLARSAFVVSSNTHRTPAHLAVFDPQLFYTLKKKGMKTEVNIDFQAECLAPHTTIWSTSPSTVSPTPLRTMIRSLATLLSSIVSIDVMSLFFSSSLMYSLDAQPTMTNGICTFQKITPYERCAQLHYYYSISLNTTNQFPLEDLKCPRFGHLFPIPGTKLTLVIADHACESYVPRSPFHYKPHTLKGCQILSSYPRRRPDYTFETWSIHEENKECDASPASSQWTASITLILFTITILFGFLH